MVQTPRRSVLLAALPLAPVILMALPPQSDEALGRDAQRILLAEVTAVFQREVAVPDGTDTDFVAQVRPVKDERAPAGGALEAVLYVHFRQTGKRPPGWAGPSGQDSALRPGPAPVRLFLTRAKDGRWTLLEPNGWSRVEPAR